MHEVTCRLVELLEHDISRQRLDSTHVFSNMASFGRTRLLGVTVKRFLTQVKRHAPEAYDALPEELRARYAVSVGPGAPGFSQKKKSPEQRTKTLQSRFHRDRGRSRLDRPFRRRRVDDGAFELQSVGVPARRDSRIIAKSWRTR